MQFHPKVIECLNPHLLKRNPEYFKNYNTEVWAADMCISAVVGTLSKWTSFLFLCRYTVNYQDIARGARVGIKWKDSNLVWGSAIPTSRICKMCLHINSNFISIEKSIFFYLFFFFQSIFFWPTHIAYMQHLFILI